MQTTTLALISSKLGQYESEKSNTKNIVSIKMHLLYGNVNPVEQNYFATSFNKKS